MGAEGAGSRRRRPGHVPYPLLSTPKMVQRAPAATTGQTLQFPLPYVPSSTVLPQPPVTVPASSAQTEPFGRVSGQCATGGRSSLVEEPPSNAGGGVASQPAQQSGKGGDDIDDLSRRLYDRIRDRLKAELYLDRERAGQLNDLTV